MVYEFLDNDQFSNLDTLMLQLAPGRCLLTLDAGAAEGKPRGDMAKVSAGIKFDQITVRRISHPLGRFSKLAYRERRRDGTPPKPTLKARLLRM